MAIPSGYEEAYPRELWEQERSLVGARRGHSFGSAERSPASRTSRLPVSGRSCGILTVTLVNLKWLNSSDATSMCFAVPIHVGSSLAMF